MGQAASYCESVTSLKSLNGGYYGKPPEDPEHLCNYKTSTVALAIILFIVSSAFVVTVLSVLLLRRPSDALVARAVPSLASPFASSLASLFVPYCPEKWVGYGGKCYYFSEEEKSWNASQHFCSSVNASLAGIDTLQEKDFVMRYAGLVEHWIGLRRESGQPWKWVNGTQLKQQLFEVRAEGDCAYVSDVFVSSSRCYSVRNWICSKPDAYMKAKENAVAGISDVKLLPQGVFAPPVHVGHLPEAASMQWSEFLNVAAIYQPRRQSIQDNCLLDCYRCMKKLSPDCSISAWSVFRRQHWLWLVEQIHRHQQGSTNHVIYSPRASRLQAGTMRSAHAQSPFLLCMCPVWASLKSWETCSFSPVAIDEWVRRHIIT